MGNGDDMCALQADQIKRETDGGPNATQSSSSSSSTTTTGLPSAGNLKDNSRLNKNGVGAAGGGIIGSTNTGSVPGGYDKGTRSPLSEGEC